MHSEEEMRAVVERRTKIRQLRRRGYETPQDLSRKLKVSIRTIYNDLAEIEKVDKNNLNFLKGLYNNVVERKHCTIESINTSLQRLEDMWDFPQSEKEIEKFLDFVCPLPKFTIKELEDGDKRNEYNKVKQKRSSIRDRLTKFEYTTFDRKMRLEKQIENYKKMKADVEGLTQSKINNIINNIAQSHISIKQVYYIYEAVINDIIEKLVPFESRQAAYDVIERIKLQEG